ncbi:MAG: LysR substrate-binding domain-containing protein [Ramlibacter sp.]
MEFDLTDLRLFVLTADESNLTRAAAGRHLSLAAASARIKALEQQAGLALLYREARGVRLTPAGEAFLHHARGVLRQAEQLRVDLQDYSGGLRGHVRLFANTTAVTDFLPEILPAFLKANPKVNVDLQEKPNADIARGVLDGRADLGIVAGQVDTLGLRAIHFSTDRLVLVVPRSHRFARRKRMAFAETLDEDAIGMNEGSTLQAFLAQVTDKLGKPLKLRIQLSSFDAMCRMIGAGVGVGVVPESAALRNLAPLNLAAIELTDAWSVRERYILVREREALPAYSQSLIDTLCAHYRPAPAQKLPSALARHPR